MAKYRWKRGVPGKVSVDDAVAELEKIKEKHGKITPDVVVKEAKKKKSPLHNCFEWDDTVAAAAWRMTQAKYMIRQIEVVITAEEDKPPVRIRAFHSVIEEDQAEYVTVQQAKDNPDYWEQVMNDAIAAIVSWKTKYANLKGFEDLYSEIEKIVTKKKKKR